MTVTLEVTAPPPAGVRRDNTDRASRPRVTQKRFEAHVRRFRERVLDPSYEREVERSLRGLATEDEDSVRDELQAIKTWAAELLATLR